ncbi:MAG: tetratricopeptide repeat protein [Candidatus Hinthialibacter antarcticus]|nr:tetratricopeptide repeat protein [Candidatus Hinthialibacter antarcticus]
MKMNSETKDFFSIHRIFPLAIAPLVLYACVIRGEFVYDDVAITVVENPALTGEASMWEVLSWDRPLREFTYMLDHALWGYNPIGYHLQNIAWHTANVLMAYFLFGMLGVSTSTAFWAALIFCVHPINVEATAWISGRKEQLCLFFELVSCACFVAALQDRQRIHRLAYAASIIALLLALLSKQVAAAAPLLMVGALIAYRRISLETIAWKRLAFAAAPMFVIVIGFVIFDFGLFSRLQQELVVGAYFDPGARDASYTVLSALLTPLATFGRSAWLCLVPLDLTIEHAFPPVQSLFDTRWLLGGAVLAAAVAGCAFTYKRRPEISFALFWFMAAWAPVSGALPISYLIADRYLYIPCVGFSLLIAFGLVRLLGKYQRGPLIGLSMVVLLFSAQTINRSLDWRNEISLWKSAVDSRPQHAPAWAALGSAYHRIGIEDKAFETWNHALSLDANQPQVWLNMGRAESQRGDADAAERNYRKALEAAPNYGTAYYNLAALIEKRGDNKQALEYFRLAAKYLTGKRNAERRQGLAHYNISRLLLRLGEPDAAYTHLVRAEVLAPLYAPIYNLKGMLFGRNPVEARSAFQQAIELDPLYGEAYYNLGVLEWKQGNQHQAQAHWKRAVNANPNLQPAIDEVRQDSPKNRE